jgi:hypothetical protein
MAGDHSNTQFALLGLWVADRHRVPVRWVLRRADAYFRLVQAEDGSWSYATHTPNFRASNTCAGLLALAMGYGVDYRPSQGTRTMPQAPVADARIDSGLRFLGEQVRRLPAPPDEPGTKRPWQPRWLGADAMGDLYFLWSLERVAVVYDLGQVGGRDWYRWAAAHLLANQAPDGHFHDRYAGPIDTSFALLVLRRSNLARDLTQSLEGVVHTEGRRPSGTTAVVPAPPRPKLSGIATPGGAGRNANPGAADETDGHHPPPTRRNGGDGRRNAPPGVADDTEGNKDRGKE